VIFENPSGSMARQPSPILRCAAGVPTLMAQPRRRPLQCDSRVSRLIPSPVGGNVNSDETSQPRGHETVTKSARNGRLFRLLFCCLSAASQLLLSRFIASPRSRREHARATTERQAAVLAVKPVIPDGLMREFHRPSPLGRIFSRAGRLTQQADRVGFGLLFSSPSRMGPFDAVHSSLM
jgi:hypothetical protein